MSDFLMNLVQRTYGSQQEIKPRIAPLIRFPVQTAGESEGDHSPHGMFQFPQRPGGQIHRPVLGVHTGDARRIAVSDQAPPDNEKLKPESPAREVSNVKDPARFELARRGFEPSRVRRSFVSDQDTPEFGAVRNNQNELNGRRDRSATAQMPESHSQGQLRLPNQVESAGEVADFPKPAFPRTEPVKPENLNDTSYGEERPSAGFSKEEAAAPLIRPESIRVVPIPLWREEEAPPEVPPTVSVTIGRVEVRATPPRGSPHQKASPVPVMSLDEYMRKRTAGEGQ